MSDKSGTLVPAVFLGHGSPMNTLEHNDYTEAWADLGESLPRPRAVLAVSAHWVVGATAVTAMAQPRTIHDFSGFPPELFAYEYPAPGSPEVAAEVAELLAPTDVLADLGEWGLDHGTWSVLAHVYPRADVPVVQLSIDGRQPLGWHLELAQRLAPLREAGVMVLGRGNVVHNLQQAQRGAAGNQAYDWALEFDQTIAGQVQQGQLDALQNFQKLGSLASMAHPSHEHFLPLLYAAGAVAPGEQPEFFNTSFQLASISMRSMLWGGR
jgi:4,5-DOPA dioxygenase extradiol